MGLGLQPIVARALFPLTGLSTRATRGKGQLLTLTYHRVGTPEQLWPNWIALAEATAEQFAAQMHWLRQHCDPVTLEQARQIVFGELACPPRAVLVTFDDGYREDILRLVPVLRETGIRPTVFLPTSFIGTNKRFWWDRIALCLQTTAKWRLRSNRHEQLDVQLDSPHARQQAIDRIVGGSIGQLPAEERDDLIAHLEHILEVPNTTEADRPVVLSWNEVRNLHPVLDYGAHTQSHALLSQIDPATVQRELEGSKRALEDELGIPCTVLAIPYGNDGSYTDASIAQCADAGFELVFSLEPALRQPQVDRGCALVNRIAVGARDGVEGMAIKIAWPRLFAHDYISQLQQLLRS